MMITIKCKRIIFKIFILIIFMLSSLRKRKRRDWSCWVRGHRGGRGGIGAALGLASGGSAPALPYLTLPRDPTNSQHCAPRAACSQLAGGFPAEHRAAPSVMWASGPPPWWPWQHHHRSTCILGDVLESGCHFETPETLCQWFSAECDFPPAPHPRKHLAVPGRYFWLSHLGGRRAIGI